MSLVDELNIMIKDKIIENDLNRTIDRMIPIDYTILQMIMQKGPIGDTEVRKSEQPDEFKETLKRCRARNLVVPVRCAGSHYKYDITNLGMEILKVKDFSTADPKKLKRQLREQD